MRRLPANKGSEVPFLTDKRIEEEAVLLLAQYGEKHGIISAPPVPVDEVLEVHLGLTYELDDLEARFGHADVHGAIWFNERLVRVDQKLDPVNNPNMMGRYHFTLAHESGHWCLHRHLYQDDPQQGRIFDGDGKPAFICRSSQKPPVEIQADKFAGCLLMPRDLIKAAWASHHGGLEPVVLDDLRAKESKILPAEMIRRGGMVMDRRTMDNVLFEWAGRPLAKQFKVSAEAMRIRLEKLEYLLREKPLF